MRSAVAHLQSGFRYLIVTPPAVSAQQSQWVAPDFWYPGMSGTPDPVDAQRMPELLVRTAPNWHLTDIALTIKNL
jgi:hypothetical protein